MISTLIIQKISRVLGIKSNQIDPDLPFDKFGIDSIKAMLIVGELEDWLDFELPATLLWDYNTINSLSNYLKNHIDK
jgi:acyl carrier protein